jgi:cytochrome c553
MRRRSMRPWALTTPRTRRSDSCGISHQRGERQPVLRRCATGQRLPAVCVSVSLLNVAWTVHPGWIWRAEYNYYGYGEGGPSGAPFCSSCHGSTGTPSPGMAKMMDIKAASEYKSTAQEQFDAVKNGKGKMKPFAGKLTDDQIKGAVAYFRTLK